MTKLDYASLLIEMGKDGRLPATLTKSEKIAINAAIGHEVYNPNIDSFAGKTMCGYRCPESGKRCVVGILIPDEKYTIQLENLPCNRTAVKLAVNRPDGVDDLQLTILQEAHDSLAVDWDASKWELRVKEILNVG